MTIAWRRIPPSHAPLRPAALARALVSSLAGRDLRPRLAERLRRTYLADTALLTDRGTTALELALRTMSRREDPSAPVALPAYACYDLATAAVGAGVPLVLYDLDPRTLAPDPGSLAACLAVGARVVVVAPLYGVPVDWGMVTRVVGPSGARVIEDAAQGLGAEWDGRPLGTLAEVGVLSFGRGKGWTGGSGGALLFRRTPPGVPADRVDRPTLGEELGGVGAALGQWLFGRPALFALPAALPWLHLGETRYRAPEAARPMSRGAATLIAATWEEAWAEALRRRAVGAELRSALRGTPGLEIPAAPAPGVPGELRLPVLVRRGGAALAAAPWARQLGVGPAYPTTLAELPVVQERLLPAWRHRRWQGAEELVDQLVTIPTHSMATEEDRGLLVRALERYAAVGRPSSRS